MLYPFTMLRNPCRAGVPNLQNLMPGDLRWSWCNNNRNKVHNKCNVFESSWNSYPPLAPGKLSSMKLVPGAKKIGDPAVLREQTKQWRTSLVVQWLILCVSTAGGLGLIPSWRSSACLAVWPKRGGETMETSCPKELWIPKDQVELSKICLIFWSWCVSLPFLFVFLLYVLFYK